MSKVTDGAKIKVKIERLGELAVVTVTGDKSEECFQFGVQNATFTHRTAGDISVIELEGIGKESSGFIV